ncbi:hypothetical protein [Rhodovulum sp.]|uniref:hypothetical protein n=1 Tax=Rhodovulum sp. TaxID=34009 RepID=UPI00257E8199|nr:hypothetical protein [Rhodovulum sp.]
MLVEPALQPLQQRSADVDPCKTAQTRLCSEADEKIAIATAQIQHAFRASIQNLGPRGFNPLFV